MLGKRPPSFLSYSFENKLCGTSRRSQTASGCGVDFVLALEKKKKKGPPVHHVWPCAKSQAERAERGAAFWGAKGEKGGN